MVYVHIAGILFAGWFSVVFLKIDVEPHARFPTVINLNNRSSKYVIRDGRKLT
jgi:hypothetical protein